MEFEAFKGSIDIMILSVLKKKKSYGYEITKIIKDKSNYEYSIGEGTLYTSLRRLESKKLIKSSWIFEEERNRKYYTITEQGSQYLKEKNLALKKLSNLIDNLMI